MKAESGFDCGTTEYRPSLAVSSAYRECLLPTGQGETSWHLEPFARADIRLLQKAKSQREGARWDYSRNTPPLEIRAAEYFLRDRKSTRLNSSHLGISYAVFCLKKKTKTRE